MASSPAAPWAELETDCLVEVFRRLELDEVATAVPSLVCRGWRRAAGDPSLYRSLDLRRDHLARFMPWSPLAAAFARLHAVRRFTFSGFLRLCLSRSSSSLSSLSLPPLLSSSDLDLVAASCPSLRRLSLPKLSPADESRLPDLIPMWPRLEHLELESKPASSFPALAAAMAVHCPGLVGIRIASGSIKPEDAAAMAASMRRLRWICLDRCYLPRRELLAILAGCGELREFTARGCVGFDEKDEEVIRRGARIERFDIGGSRLLDEADAVVIDGGYCDGDGEDDSYVDVM
uniref:F-box domain-containing protein n=1 Tax=Leersia perrieri TaxID=77586 RepID=A0A0D9VWP2_9ORYZ